MILGNYIPQNHKWVKMNFLLWNACSTGAHHFSNLVRQMSQFHGVDFIAIFETRCSGNKAIHTASKLGFQNMEIIDADGFKGGIWCVWSEKVGSVEIVVRHPQFMHVRIRSHDHRVWELTLIYASPNPLKHRELWR